MKLKLHFSHTHYNDEELAQSITNILEDSTELALATQKNNQSHINVAHYAYNNLLELYILTQPSTQHTKNIDLNPSVAAAIWNATATPGENLRGLQLFGVCERVQKLELNNALRQYSQRFKSFREVIKHPTDFAKGITDSRFFVIKVEWLKLIDEPRFGRRNFIIAQVKS